MKRRLYLQIYLSVVGVSLGVLLVLLFLGWHMFMRGDRAPRFLEQSAQEIALQLEETDELQGALFALLRQHADRVGVWASLWSADGELLAFTGPRSAERGLAAPPRPDPLRFGGRHLPRIPGVTVELADGRWLRVHPNPRGHRGAATPLVSLALLCAAIGLGAYPVSRRIARRLERLQHGVERLGSGDLSTRIEVEGTDEVADLAHAFNRSAERIETLVLAQQRILVSASHELRTPLARLRVAVELLGRSGREDLRDEADLDIAELDDLIEDLLIGARIRSGVGAQVEDVALHAVVEEEALRIGAQLRLDDVVLRGNARELRRLVRNLLENARRHGGRGEAHHDPQIAVELSALASADGGATLRVCDRGPGVAESERERIFEPFYRPADHSEASDGGVGLGLALVREVAKHHGGSSRCLPRDGGGTIFEVVLRGLADRECNREGDPVVDSGEPEALTS